ncbi:hypothetical protein [Phytomonospora endophytica]|uniref:Nitrogen fixation-related uncharacterized protein n=1 Tax=Phytomonospora endophytica TaxID=714109 RepID=A0A841FBB7_9ACTN|nr:hypothetical protein [Phytomonospora endophytica]MBB6033074.1 nitrogen fixation-related uncharacterized protein [Phytomonospora endophytica]GIG65301.1 hypothetical protein Pen01_15960 [Phytomonospora endophytica]
MARKSRSAWFKAGAAVGVAAVAVGAYGYLWLRKVGSQEDLTPPGYEALRNTRRTIADLLNWDD